MKLTVVINTLNEEANIARAINSVKGIADEVVVVDMESTDKTVEIAKGLGAKVYSHKKTNYVEPARNFAISKATGDWVLILDADEEISKALSQKIKEVVNDNDVDYYQIPRKNIIFGKWMRHARWWPDYNIRLFKKGAVTWNEAIHSVPESKGVGGELPAEENLAIIHYHYDSLEQYLERMNRYTTLYAKRLLKDGYRFNWKDVLIKPSGEFFSRYFFGAGYKDGLHGLAVSLLQTFSELSVYLKVWEEGKFEEKEVKVGEVLGEIRKVQRDQNYWQADTLLKITKNPLYLLRRKFKF